MGKHGMIEFLTVTEDVGKWHRGMSGQIGVEEGGRINRYNVTCVSKYRLRSGLTRIKFEAEKLEMSETARARTAFLVRLYNNSHATDGG